MYRRRPPRVLASTPSNGVRAWSGEEGRGGGDSPTTLRLFVFLCGTWVATARAGALICVLGAVLWVVPVDVAIGPVVISHSQLCQGSTDTDIGSERP